MYFVCCVDMYVWGCHQRSSVNKCIYVLYVVVHGLTSSNVHRMPAKVVASLFRERESGECKPPMSDPPSKD